MVGLVIALLAGGATAAAGYVGAKVANSAMNVISDVANYVYFDKENGWDRDHPEELNKPVAGRVMYLFKEGLKNEKVKEGETS